MDVQRASYDWAFLAGLSALVAVGACATGSTETDETDDGGPATTTGPTTTGGGQGGDPIGPTVGPGPGSGGSGATGGSPDGGGGASAGGTGGNPVGAGGMGGNGGMGGDPVVCTPILLDPGFEAGTPNPSWSESSTNFTTPLCTVADCGVGGGTGPRSGTWWFWGGGAAATFSTVQEIAIVSQTLVIPAGTAMLEWYQEVPACDTGVIDYFGVVVDGTVLYQTDSFTEPTCGVVGYQHHQLDLDAYANGGSHTISFEVDQLYDDFFSTSASNFFVDDVLLTSCQ